MLGNADFILDEYEEDKYFDTDKLLPVLCSYEEINDEMEDIEDLVIRQNFVVIKPSLY